MTEFQTKISVICISLLAALFCFANASGMNLFCGTEGCGIYKGYGLFGLSFYVLGGIAFLAIAGIVFASSYFRIQYILLLTLIAGLICDGLFLAYQWLYWPCSSCLIVAALFGLVALIGSRLTGGKGKRSLLLLAGVWSVFFAFVSLAVVKELVFQPWAMWEVSNPKTQVYFSPSCPSCKTVVLQILETRDLDQVVFLPICKNEEDVRQIEKVLPLIKNNHREQAIRDLFSEEIKPSVCLNPKEKFGLLCNKIQLAMKGETTVPLIVAHSIPEKKTFSPFSVFSTSPAGPGCSAIGHGNVCE